MYSRRGLLAIRAEGDVVIVARGAIDREQKSIELSGDVAPATTLNSLMGLTSLPLIREIFGESVFAASFRATGPAAAPELTVNPLSVLTPGITRRILEVLSGGRAELPSETGETPAAQPEEQQAEDSQVSP